MWQLYQRIRYYFRLRRRLRESAALWAELESDPTFNEAMEDGIAQIAEQRKRDYEPVRPNG